jgi:alpha-galactosidase
LKENGEGYFLLFRENNEDNIGKIETWLKEGEHIECTLVLGDGKTQDSLVKHNGVLEIELPKKNSFVMYKYKIRK